MKSNESEELSGPAVQKREILLVVGLVACWGIALYFLVGKTSKHPMEFLSHSRIRVNQNELAPAILKKFLSDDETPTRAHSSSRPPISMERMNQDDVDQTLRTMKEGRDRRDDSFSTLITAEPPPPDTTVNGGQITLEEPIAPSGVEGQDSGEESSQSGDLLEPATEDPVEQAPTTERIKS
jgi:hypothetical protein